MRELDYEIAEKFLGWVWCVGDGYRVLVPPKFSEELPKWDGKEELEINYELYSPPHFSTNSIDAVTLMNEVRRFGHSIDIISGNKWTCEIIPDYYNTNCWTQVYMSAEADTIAMSIALATQTLITRSAAKRMEPACLIPESIPGYWKWNGLTIFDRIAALFGKRIRLYTTDIRSGVRKIAYASRVGRRVLVRKVEYRTVGPKGRKASY